MIRPTPEGSRSRHGLRLVGPALAAAVALIAAGCGGSNDAGPSSTSTSGAAKQEVTVFAAASLTAAFKEIATQAPDLDVKYNFDGSPTLVDQINAKPDVADVLATADQANMKKATDEGLVVAHQKIFATNTAVMILPSNNPGSVSGLDDSLNGKKLVVCAATVPCGAAARSIAQADNFTLKPVSEEQKVTDVVGKVTSGEADAGIVFSTDARSAGDKVQVIQMPGADKVVNNYPIALVSKAPNSAAGDAFISVVTGEKGRAVLQKYGFTLP